MEIYLLCLKEMLLLNGFVRKFPFMGSKLAFSSW